jgi:alpha-glucosidase
VWWRAEVEVRNPDTRYRFLLAGPWGQRWLNALGLFAHDVPDVHDFRLLAFDPPPAWALDAVVYEIFPDRFARSAAAPARPVPDWAIPCDWDTPVIGRGPETPYQFYGGDLDGIAERLDHLAELGVDTVYLTPIFPARSNHRYDAASFSHVDPLLGGDEALARLSAALHARGMRLLGDLTTNHCGESHPWFQTALAARGALERDLFYFAAGSDDYEAWCGVTSLPKLNWGSRELRRRFVEGADSVAARWLRAPYGLDGWRVDVANMTGRLGADAYTVEAAQLVRRAVATVRPDGLVVAEHNHDATADLDRDGWHGTMNYAGFLRPVWSWLRAGGLAMSDFLGVPGDLPRRGGVEAVATMRSFAALMSWRSWVHSWTFLSTHDSARVRTIVGDGGRAEVALGLQMTLPGVPMVFAGDELGLDGCNGEDGRRPMPWHRAGAWDRARLGRYRDLIALRRKHETLRRGGLRWAHADADSVTFLRETEAETLLVHARRASGGAVVLPDLAPVAAENVYGGASVDVLPDGSARLPSDGPTFQVWRIG